MLEFCLLYNADIIVHVLWLLVGFYSNEFCNLQNGNNVEKLVYFIFVLVGDKRIYAYTSIEIVGHMFCN